MKLFAVDGDALATAMPMSGRAGRSHKTQCLQGNPAGSRDLKNGWFGRRAIESHFHHSASRSRSSESARKCRKI